MVSLSSKLLQQNRIKVQWLSCRYWKTLHQFFCSKTSIIRKDTTDKSSIWDCHCVNSNTPFSRFFQGLNNKGNLIFELDSGLIQRNFFSRFKILRKFRVYTVKKTASCHVFGPASFVGIVSRWSIQKICLNLSLENLFD